ncbi:Phage Tail Collar Domain [Vibrio crassostreae]|nr:Phage Tail Collar Domain [Vibrio crassostreae]
MHYLNNGSQVENVPPLKPRVGTRGYFTESNDDGSPSYPGQDWFNAVIREFQTAATDGGITFDPDRFDHLSRFIQSLGTNAVYDGLVGFVLPDSTMQVSPDRAFLADGAEYNRADYPKLWNKVNGTAMLVSQSLINADPETYAANYGDGDGSTTFTLPNYGLRPHLAAAGAFGAVGTTVEDHIQNIMGNLSTGDSGTTLGTFVSGVGFTDGPFDVDYGSDSNRVNNATTVGTGSNRKFKATFDAARVARTGSYTEVNSSFVNFYIVHGETA